MLNIQIKTIPDKIQRYNTVGDYYGEIANNETVNISDMGDWRYEFLTALHELIESSLCRKRSITLGMIDSFDAEFEKNRKADDVSEAGDNPSAPYYREHQFATKIEKMVAEELEVDWNTYGKIVDKLMDE